MNGRKILGFWSEIKIHVLQLYINRNSNLMDVAIDDNLPTIADYRNNYSLCLSCWKFNFFKRRRLIKFCKELPEITKSYFNTLGYNNWQPNINEKRWWVTISDRASLADFHVIDKAQPAPTIFEYNYFKTKKDAEGLVRIINQLKKNLRLKIIE